MKCSVLVVEDSRTQAEALCALLEDEYEVTLARSGEEALQRLGEREFDLILSDVVMPGIGGYELCRRIKQSPEWSGTPVVLLTSLVDPMDIIRGLEAGADNYITKPYDPEHLLARLRHVLGNRHLRRGVKTSMGVSVRFMGTDLTITSGKEQILDLLLSSVEDVIRTNRALEESRRELADAHAQLEAFAREKAQEAHVSAERYRTLMQNAGDAIFVLDRAGTVQEANARAAELLGVDLASLVGRSLESFVPPQQAERFRDGLAQTLRGGEVRAREQVMLGGDGRPVFCEVTASWVQVGGDGLVLAILRDVTERRQAAEQLRARERQLAEAQQIARMGSWEWDLVEHVAWSDEMYRIFGVEPARFQPRSSSLVDFVHPDDLEHADRALRTALEGQGRLAMEFRIRRPDGSEAEIQIRGDVVRDEHGDPVRIVGTAQDVTERREAERRLEASEERYRSLFEYNPAAVFSLDLEGRFTSTNPACYTLTGYDPGELIGTPFLPLIVPEHVPLALERFQASLRGVSQTYQIAVSHRDGHRLELSVTNTPIVVGGRQVGVFGIAEDVSERVRAQEALRRSEEMLRTVIDASPVATVVLDREGNVRSWSAAAERMFGWTAAEALHGPPPFVPKEGDPELRLLYERVLQGDPLTETEVVRRRKDGSPVPASISVAPLREADGSVSGIVAAIADLTARRAAEEALREREQQLVQAQKMEAVGRLAGGIAHDFNNLLTAIKGTTQILLLDVAEDDPIREDLLEIDRSVDRAAALTRQLLIFSRKGVVEPRVLELNELVRRAETLLRRTLREDVAFLTRLDAAHPHVLADAGQIEQVLLNLTVNARDAMPAGGELRITTHEVQVDHTAPEHAQLNPGRYVVLSVVDTGEGMSAEVQERAFEPFFTTKPQGVGTGLGLSTVYGIVQQGGGLIQLESELGKGTTFRLYFPRVAGEPPEEASPAAPVAAEPRTETLLVVEDEPSVRQVVRRTLERSGHRVLLAGSGAEALEICERHQGPIDLLITDVVMPGMSGADLAARARAVRPGLRVLFMSGYTDDVISHHGVLNEGVHFINKPFSPGGLAARVREVLDGAEA